MASHPQPRGFTLIELLTVIAIIGILAAILIPTIGKVRESARNATTVSNLRQIQIGSLNYSNDNRGEYLPIRLDVYNWPAGGAPGGPTPLPNAQNRWMTHPRALAYLGDTSDATNSMQTWARIARSGSQVTVVNGGTTYEDGRQTIGINKTDLDFSPSTLGLRGRMGLKTTEVRSPERLIAFAEACDWMVTWDDVGRWEPSFDQGGTVASYVDAPAFRAGGRLLVVCYAGNVMRLTLEEAREVDRWSIF